jgi:single-strand DNA-binding protein
MSIDVAILLFGSSFLLVSDDSLHSELAFATRVMRESRRTGRLPSRFAFLSAFSVPRSRHPRPSDARSPPRIRCAPLRRCGLLPPGKLWSPSADSVQSPREWVATAHPLGKHVPQTADKPKETEPNTMFNKVILIGRLGQNAEAKTAQNNKEYVTLNIATQESWKNDKGEYETRTEWHRVFAWSNLSKFAKTLQKGQLITLEGTLRYREVEDDVEGTRFKHRITEVHATSMKRLSKIETADDPSDGAGDE